MTNYGTIFGKTEPPAIEIAENNVFVASNIAPYEKDYDGIIISGYQYDYKCYTKDEYIMLLAQQKQKISALEEELAATKIILGVD